MEFAWALGKIVDVMANKLSITIQVKFATQSLIQKVIVLLTISIHPIRRHSLQKTAKSGKQHLQGFMISSKSISHYLTIPTMILMSGGKVGMISAKPNKKLEKTKK